MGLLTPIEKDFSWRQRVNKEKQGAKVFERKWGWVKKDILAVPSDMFSPISGPLILETVGYLSPCVFSSGCPISPIKLLIGPMRLSPMFFSVPGHPAAGMKRIAYDASSFKNRDMEKKLNEMSKKSEFLKEVFTDKVEDTRSIKPVPESVNHQYGWIASKEEFQNKIPDNMRLLQLPPHYKLVIPYDHPYWCYLRS